MPISSKVLNIIFEYLFNSFSFTLSFVFNYIIYLLQVGEVNLNLEIFSYELEIRNFQKSLFYI